MSTLREGLNDVFTGKDGESLDIGRIIWAIGCLTYCSCEIYSVGRGDKFDSQAFGIGLAALMAGGGGALAMKRHTEPDPTTPVKSA